MPIVKNMHHVDKKFIIHSCTILFSCVILVALSYCFLDRDIADYVYQHHFKHTFILKDFTEISGLLMIISPFLVVISFFTKKINYISGNKYFSTMYLSSWSVTISECIKSGLKMIFGRYWPATWTEHNPSWINNHAYGFHWFHWGKWYGSFPSGHTTVIFALMSVIWLRHPHFRPFALLICCLVMIGLLGMNYHFLSDIIAGAYLGSVTGYLMVSYSRNTPALPLS